MTTIENLPSMTDLGQGTSVSVGTHSTYSSASSKSTVYNRPEVINIEVLPPGSLEQKKQRQQPHTSGKPEVEAAASALACVAMAIRDVATVLQTAGSKLTDEIPLTGTLEAFSFMSASLAGISCSLADVLRAPLVADSISATSAQALNDAAVTAERNALTLLHATSELSRALYSENDDRISKSLVSVNLSKKDIAAQEITKCDMDNYSLDHVQGSASPFQSKYDVLSRFGYTLEDVLGYGTFSVVKAAQSKIHNRKVAIKIVSKSQVSPMFQEKFLPREIEVVQILNHPNIIKFLQVIETNHCVYIVMDFAEQGNLCDIIRKKKIIQEPRAKIWFRQLVEAVHYCHNLGLVHRDIKCENVLLDAKDNIKLSEFYFVRRYEPKTMDLSQTFCGTRAYAAPEILHRVVYNPQLTDAWSLGVVLYSMVCGRLPFSEQYLDSLRKDSRLEVNFPKHRQLTPECKSLIRRILAPAKLRIKVSRIRGDPWLQGEAKSAAKPSATSSTSSKDSTREKTSDDTGSSKKKKTFSKRLSGAMKHMFKKDQPEKLPDSKETIRSEMFTKIHF